MSNYQSNEIKLINTSLIDPHPDNPRKQIGDVTDLAASIKANGLLSPLSVVPNGERYRVIAGHRRLAACKQAGTGAVPCFVLDLDPLQQLEAMVTESCQREQLTVLEEADAIQGMLDLGATTAAVAHRLGRSADYVRDRAKAASIKADVRKTRDDFDQLTIGQLMAIARYDGQPDRQERLAHAAGTSNFDYILHNIEVEDRRSQWFADVSALLATGTTGLNVIEDPGETFSDSEWHYSGAIFPAAGTPEETIEELRKQNPDAVSVHEATQTIYLWDRRDAAAEAEKEAQRAAEQAERDARQHVLEEYAATTADKRMAWLHGHLHAIKRASSSRPRQGSDSCRSSTHSQTASPTPSPAGTNTAAAARNTRRSPASQPKTPRQPRASACRPTTGHWKQHPSSPHVSNGSSTRPTGPPSTTPADAFPATTRSSKTSDIRPPTTKPATSTSSSQPSPKPTPTKTKKTRRTTNDQ